MDLLSGYDDGATRSSGEEEEEGDAPFVFKTTSIVTAPKVNSTGLVLSERGAVPASQLQHLHASNSRKIFSNLPYEQMHAPIVGPANPYTKDGMAAGSRNHKTGHVEDHHMHAFHFDDQYNTYHSTESCMVLEGQQAVHADQRKGAQEVRSVYSPEAKRQKTESERKAEKDRKLEKQALIAATDPTAEWSLGERQPWAERQVKAAKPTEEQMEWLKENGFIKDEEEEGDEKGEGKGKSKIAEKSMFHGKEEHDSVGRSWMEAPREQRPEVEQAYLPKRWIHTWSGHTKGVNAIRFFPKTGHLLLSGGLDGKIKIWDVNKSRKCMRTYMGFTKGIKDVQFNNDGRKFLSTGYDKVIKLWDTETGQAIRTFGEGKMFFVAKFHPNDDKQNVLMAGCQDKKVYQWDMDSGDLVQEYDYHLAAVNTITFVDEGRRFVSTSDDKTIRVWEFGIPVQIKYIADPSLHSLPAVTMHPNNQYFVGQSMDNQIVTYSAKDKFRQNRKKTFKGHTVAGYACNPCFSPDGRYVVSGDGEGKVWFWDWKTCKAYRNIKAHETVCIDTQWHPLENSRVATAGWDGLIKYWD